MGGEWVPGELRRMLEVVVRAGLRTCLYTGLEREELEAVSGDIIPYLTYLKTGRWRAELGGLESPRTNQRFTDLRTQIGWIFSKAEILSTNALYFFNLILSVFYDGS